MIFVLVHWYYSDLISVHVYTAMYAILQFTHMAIPPAYVIRYHLPVASSLIVMCEQARFMMIMHSYFRESQKMITESRGRSRDDIEKFRVAHPNKYIIENTTQRFRCFLYFSFAPCLVYRNVYPRIGAIYWNRVITHLSNCFACVFFT